MRKTAREIALKLIYEYAMTGGKNELTYKNLISSSSDLTGGDIPYLDKVYNGVIDNYAALTDIIIQNTEGYRSERIYKVDLAILLLAVYEIKFCKGITDAISINEAVELAKIYSTEKSYSFINGVLAKIVDS